jgi:Transcriptional regulator, AbiEi antitoxin/Protein of unknown function (DUF559)
VAYKPPHIWGQTSNTPLAALAARQHGVVTIAQLVDLGLDRRAVSRWARDGRLHALYRGVYAVGHTALSREAEWLAAVLACGDGAALCRVSATELWQIWRKPALWPDVVVPQQRRPQGAIRLLVSRTLTPQDIVVYRGIPITHVARTLVDLSDVLTAHQLAYVIHEAAFRKRLNLEATRQAMARATGRHRLAVLERAIELYLSGSAGTRSELEDTFLTLLPLAQVPEPLVNTIVEGEEADCFWPDAGLIVEVDGPGHRRPTAKRDDARKEAIWRAAGYEILRFTEMQIEQRPDEVVQVMRARGVLRPGRGPRPGRGGRR